MNNLNIRCFFKVCLVFIIAYIFLITKLFTVVANDIGEIPLPTPAPTPLPIPVSPAPPAQPIPDVERVLITIISPDTGASGSGYQPHGNEMRGLAGGEHFISAGTLSGHVFSHWTMNVIPYHLWGNVIIYDVNQAGTFLIWNSSEINEIVVQAHFIPIVNGVGDGAGTGGGTGAGGGNGTGGGSGNNGNGFGEVPQTGVPGISQLIIALFAFGFLFLLSVFYITYEKYTIKKTQ